jgi:[protein-PII] uridylyltransferase
MTTESIRDDRQLIDVDAVDAALAAGENPRPVLRRALSEADETLRARFTEGTPASQLVPLRARMVDAVVTRLWHHCLAERAWQACLVAVGGYGRGELHPGSDTDVMVLLPDNADDGFTEGLEQFVMLLWDVGLEVGHSVRTVADCISESQRDITVITNLVESRCLAGAVTLYERMEEATAPSVIWPSRAFFEAKWEEQLARHAKYHDTAYNLEPNIKESPGGLRDIHMVGWVAKRHFNAETLHDLVDIGFLTEAEHDELIQGQHFLWDVRFALHITSGRREDRLLFDLQISLASQFGYSDSDHTLGVEQFMQRYYRTIMLLNRLNEMLLQLYQEAILYADIEEAPTPINKRFQLKRGFLEVIDSSVFRRYPFALLELFLIIQQRPGIKGVRASTIRLVRENRHRVDERFRTDLRCRSLFMEILRQPSAVTQELRRMHAYGLLGRYIPAFGEITGRMQYDLFHVYTVDTHILMVVSHLRRFAMPEHSQEFPLCSDIMRRLPKPELLYLAGLFHDIAKGRGGDHSVLGEGDAYAFCAHHGLSRYDSRLVAWLVRHHLLMSMTAQRKDISDPQVINEFARQVGDLHHLDYLYLLTVADIRGTDPKLWNSWRAALLRELYQVTKRAIRRGLGNPIDQDQLIEETQSRARRLLRDRGLHHMTVRSIWRPLPPDYFLRYAADEIAWHTEAIHAHRRSANPERPLVLLEPNSSRGGTEVFVYTRDRDNLFALTVSALDQLELNIQDARVITTENGYTVDSYQVLEDSSQPVAGDERREAIIEHLTEALARTDQLPALSRRAMPRQLRHFNTPTQITFTQDQANNRTAMELITGDQPGLLAQVGYTFARCDIRLQNAKVATLGERADDVFFVTDADNEPLAAEQQQAVEDALMELLEDDGDLMAHADGT